jgi:hypothetical protein
MPMMFICPNQCIPTLYCNRRLVGIKVELAYLQLGNTLYCQYEFLLTFPADHLYIEIYSVQLGT